MLITGSRDWPQDDDRVIMTIGYYFGRFHDNSRLTLVHGACPTGVDAIVERLGDYPGVETERHPAEWDVFGKRAGYVRNQAMVDLGADVCLAFIKNGSRGATMTADLAEKAGIPTHRYTL